MVLNIKKKEEDIGMEGHNAVPTSTRVGHSNGSLLCTYMRSVVDYTTNKQTLNSSHRDMHEIKGKLPRTWTSSIQ